MPTKNARFFLMLFLALLNASGGGAPLVSSEVTTQTGQRGQQQITPQTRLDNVLKADPVKALGDLLPYARKGHPTAIYLIKELGQKNPHAKAIDDHIITFFLEDPKGWNWPQDFRRKGSGSGSFSAAGLFAYGADDYTSATRTLIREKLRAVNPEPSILLACGAADMRNEIPILHGYIDRWREREGKVDICFNAWYAKLACARMGDSRDVSECIETVQSQDKFTQALLLADIGYIRQPEAIEYLKRVIFWDSRMPNPVDHDLPGERHALFALDVLTTCLKGFPVEWKPGRWYYPEDTQLEKARKWMNEQKEWKIIR